jgi:hypothetical protein
MTVDSFSGFASREGETTGDQRASEVITVFTCPTCRLLMSDFETIDSADGDWYATCCWRCGHRFGGGSRTKGALDLGKIEDPIRRNPFHTFDGDTGRCVEPDHEGMPCHD